MSCEWFYWYICALAMQEYVYLTTGSEKKNRTWHVNKEISKQQQP